MKPTRILQVAAKWNLLVGVPQSTGFAVGLTNHVLFLLAVMPGGVLHFIGSGNRTRASVTADAAPADGPTR